MQESTRKRPYAVRNWGEFQHYKKRTPPWVKLHRKLLDDIDYHKCDPLAAKCLPLIWLIASECDGSLPDLPELAFRLRITESQCAKVISALSSWLYQDASNGLADCKQDATLETETEGEEKAEADCGDTPPEPEKKTRPRNLEMDALGCIEGDLAELNQAAWKRIAKALKDIREVTPDVSPEEIVRRASNYRQHFEGAACTATALAKHWAKCKTGPTARTGYTPPTEYAT